MTKIEREALERCAILKPEIGRDGDQYRVLFGEDLQSGVAGFGDTIHGAILDWNNSFLCLKNRKEQTK